MSAVETEAGESKIPIIEGPHKEQLTLAQRMQDGILAHDTVEDKVDELFGWTDFNTPVIVERISTDWYDNSLEIFITNEAPADLKATPEIAEAIYAMGFDRFWVNWPDGTEQYCYGSYVGLRKPKNKAS